MIFRKISFLGLLLSVFVSSCMTDDYQNVNPVIDEVEDSEWVQMRDNAFNAFDNAFAEFYADVPTAFDSKKLKPKGIQSVDEIPAPPAAAGDEITYEIEYSDKVSYSEIEEKDYGVQEKVQALAWEAQLTKNDAKLVSYLQETGLYQKALDISAKYSLEQHAKNLSTRSKAIPKSEFTSASYINGDVFLKYDQSSSSSSGSNNGGSSSGSSSGSGNILNWLVPGKWGHAAFLDAQKRAAGGNYYLLSSSNETDSYKNNSSGAIGRTGYDKVEGYWTTATSVRICRVKNTSANQQRAAIDYAKRFINTPWTPLTNRTENNKFYCSKVVYRGWLSQGRELEPHYSSVTKLPWVPYPVFDHWAYKKLLGIKIWYPVFRTEYIKDLWVTPTDLDEDSDTQVIKTI